MKTSDSFSNSISSFREALFSEEDEQHRHDDDPIIPVVPIHRLRYKEYQKHFNKLDEMKKKQIPNNNSNSHNSDLLRLSNSSSFSSSSSQESFSLNYSITSPSPNNKLLINTSQNFTNSAHLNSMSKFSNNDFIYFEDEVEGDACVSNLPNLFSNSMFLNDPWHNENFFYDNFEKNNDGVLKNNSASNSTNNLAGSISTSTSMNSINSSFQNLSSLNQPNSNPTNPSTSSTVIKQEGKDWRIKDKVKIVSAILVMCLNPGVDPPDLIRPNPSSKLICWKDPMNYQKNEAIVIIGDSLQAQYEKLQSKIKFKQCLDPILDDLKKCCLNTRKLVKNERILFHYNGHGVPKPTSNGEFWVFGKHYTHYNPIAVCELKEWIGSPTLFLLDCSNAGVLIPHLIKESNGVQNKYDNYFTSANIPSQTQNMGSMSMNGSIPPSITIPSIQTIPSDDTDLNFPTLVLAACRANERLPYHPSYPSDIFTSCLTTPIQLSMRWFILQNSHLMKNVSLTLCDLIPGKDIDRRTPRGEIAWILTTITDTIAWNLFNDESNQYNVKKGISLRNKKVFQKIFRTDLLAASLFRNFLVAQRIMKSFGCTPQSYPPIPDTSSNSLWLTWDLTLESFLTHYNNLFLGTAMIYSKNNMSFNKEISIESLDPNLLVNSPQPNLSFFNDQLRSFEIWLDFNNNVELIAMPEQLPIILQVLLSQSHRIVALKLLKKFLSLGNEAVRMSLVLGIYPYILKLLQNPSSELLSLLISIWAAVISYDPLCIQDLIRDKMASNFIRPLTNSDKDYTYSQSVRTMSLYILSEICSLSNEGQQQCLSNNLHTNCIKILDEFSNESSNSSHTTSQNNTNNNSSNGIKPHMSFPSDSSSNDNFDYKNTNQINESFNYIQSKNSTIKLWACMAFTRLCINNIQAKYQVISENCHIKLQNLLSDTDPSIRAAACLALGELFGATNNISSNSYRTGSFSNLNFRDPSGSFNENTSNFNMLHNQAVNNLQNTYRQSFSSNSDDGCSISFNSGTNMYEEFREFEMSIAINLLECLTDGSVMVRYEALVAISKMFLYSYHFDTLNLTAKYVLIKTYEKQLSVSHSMANLTKSMSTNSTPNTDRNEASYSERRNRSYSESLKNINVSSNSKNQNNIIYPWLLSQGDTKEIIREIENYVRACQASSNPMSYHQPLNRSSRGCSFGSLSNINSTSLISTGMNSMGVINETETENSNEIGGNYLKQFKNLEEQTNSLNSSVPSVFSFNLASNSGESEGPCGNNSIHSNSSQTYVSTLSSGYFKIWVSLVEVGTRDPHHILTQFASMLTSRIHARLALKEKRKLKEKPSSTLSDNKSSSLWRSKSGSLSGSNLSMSFNPQPTNLKSSQSSNNLYQLPSNGKQSIDLHSPIGVATGGNFSFLNAPLSSSSSNTTFASTTTSSISSTNSISTDIQKKKSLNNETISFPNLGFPSFPNGPSNNLSITTDFSSLNLSSDHEVSPKAKSVSFGPDLSSSVSSTGNSINGPYAAFGSSIASSVGSSDSCSLKQTTLASQAPITLPSPLLNSVGKSIFQELLKDDFFHAIDDEDDFRHGQQSSNDANYNNYMNIMNVQNEDDIINANYPILQMKPLKSNFYECFKKLYLLPDLQFDYHDDPLSIHSSIRNYRNNKLSELLLIESFYRNVIFKDLYDDAHYGIVDRKAITKFDDVGLNLSSSFSAEKDSNQPPTPHSNSNNSNIISSNSIFKFEQKCTFAADGQNLNNSLVMFHSFQDLIVVASDSIASIWSISANCKIAEIKNRTRSLLKYPTMVNSSTPPTSANPYTSFASLGSNYHQYLHQSYDSSRVGTPNKSKSQPQPMEFNTTKITSMCWINESYNPLLMLGSDNGVVKIWKDSSTNPSSILSDKPQSSTTVIGGYNHAFNSMNSPSTPVGKQAVGAIDLSTSFCALPDIVSTSLGSGLISSWQQAAGTLVVGGNSSTIRLWDLGREQLVRVFNTGRETCLTCMATSTVSSYNSSVTSCLSSNNSSATSALASLFQSMNMGGVGGASGGGIGTGNYMSSEYHNYDLNAESVDETSNVNGISNSFSPLTWTFAGFADGYSSIYDERVQSRGGVVSEMKFHNKWINCIHLRPDISEVITGSVNGEIKFTDLRMMRTYRTLATNKSVSSQSSGPHDSSSSMRCLVVHPCAPILAFAKNDSIRMTSYSGEPLGQAIKYYDGFLGQRIGPVSSLSFHPKKLLLAVSSSDGIVSVFGPSDRILQGIEEQIYY